MGDEYFEDVVRRQSGREERGMRAVRGPLRRVSGRKSENGGGGTYDSMSCSKRDTTMGKLSLEIIIGNFANQTGNRVETFSPDDESAEEVSIILATVHCRFVNSHSRTRTVQRRWRGEKEERGVRVAIEISRAINNLSSSRSISPIDPNNPSTLDLTNAPYAFLSP